MSMPKEGWLSVSSDPPFNGCVIVDEISKGTRTTLWDVNSEELHSLCALHRFDYVEVMTLLSEQEPNVHTVMFDAEAFRKYLSEKREQ